MRAELKVTLLQPPACQEEAKTRERNVLEVNHCHAEVVRVARDLHLFQSRNRNKMKENERKIKKT